MHLAAFFEAERGRAARLAAKTGVAAAHLSQMAAGERPVRPDYCVSIERATEGQVRRWDLRPADWYLIWPELIGAEGAPPVPDTQTAAA